MVALSKCLEVGRGFFHVALQSNTVQLLGTHWKTSIPKVADKTPRDHWGQITVIEKGKETQCHEYFTGERYHADSCDWAFAKTLGVAYFGKYVLGAGMIRSLGALAYESAKAFKIMHDNYSLMKKEEGFNFVTFAKNELGNFKEAEKELKRTLKNVVCFIPFYFNFFGLEPYVSAGALAYAAYNPLMMRVYLNTAEDWRRGDIPPLNDHQIQQLSVWGAVKHLSDGSYSLLHIFNMHRMEKLLPEVAAEKKII